MRADQAPARAPERELLRDRRGFVAVMFLLMLMPILALIGIGIEYNNMARAKAELDVAADSAAMVATTTAYNEIANNITTDPNVAQSVGWTAGQKSWNAQTASLSWIQSGGQAALNLTVDPTQSYKATATYTAEIPTVIGNVFHVATLNFSGASEALMGGGGGNLYFLIDTSESMGTAATPAEMLSLESATSNGTGPAGWIWVDELAKAEGIGYDDVYNFAGGSISGCAFACHFYTPNAPGQDYYSLAKSAGITLRIDVVQQAVVSTLKNISSSAKVGIYGFDDVVYSIAPAIGKPIGGTVSVTDARNAAEVADPVSIPVPPSGTQNINLGCICIERMVHAPTDSAEADHMGNTDMLNAFQKLEANPPSPSAPSYLFLLTDGAVGTGTFGLVGSTMNYSYANACSTFKTSMNNHNIKVYVLDITYWPLDSTSKYPAANAPVNTSYSSGGHTPYDDDIAPYLEQYQSSLHACADKWYQASDPASIQAQMTQMVKDAALGSAEAIFSK